MNPQYHSEVSESIHNIANALHKVGVIDQEAMHQYDQACLKPVKPIEPLTGEQIRAIRKKESLTQEAFAYYLNVSKNHISSWERGTKKPSGTALKLLNLVKNKGIEAVMD